MTGMVYAKSILKEFFSVLKNKKQIQSAHD
jgi:hypothetical protein